MFLEEGKDFIKVFNKDTFNPKHILECGQVFCFEKKEEKYIVYPENQYAEIFEFNDYYLIKTENPEYFVNWFDLKTDYDYIKKELLKFPILAMAIKFGYGIRILNQNIFETLISFIISANNNISRIKLILNNLRKKLGVKNKYGFYSFPSYYDLKSCDVAFFREIGAGYRSEYLVKILRQFDLDYLKKLEELDTVKLREILLGFCGIGPKVADCVLLFGFHRGDVFPVDTWIHKMYNKYYDRLDDRKKIRDNLVKQFGQLSGYAQQYLFYFERSSK